jgi:transcriptional regulator with PAS, ATPase and Fis domain/pSer/pThr/pTyr-binding forkhead associated (FHA) protein
VDREAVQPVKQMNASRPRIIVHPSVEGGKESIYPLEEGITRIGRNPENTIVLSDAMVSRQHAEIRFDGATVVIQDIGGKNPVRVNGEEVQVRTLVHGDRIAIGTYDLVFEFPDPPVLRVIRAAGPREEGEVSIDTASVTFEHRREGGAPEEEVRRLSRLYRLSQELLQVEDEEDLYDIALAAAAEETHAERGFLGVSLEDGSGAGGLNVVRFWDPVNEERSRALEMSETILNQITRDRRAVLVTNASDRFDASKTIHDLKIRSYVCAPMVHGERFLGLIYVDTRDKRGELDQGDLEFVSAVARLAGLGLENLRIQGNLQKENIRLRNLIGSTGELIGSHESMLNILRLIEKVSSRDASVLICGENGTGKEVIARSIHARSNRKDKPFIAVNCGAIPPNLVESELFGYEKGAFTGANQTTEGKFDLANGGSIFLDEVGEMPLDMQVKFLRVLQERKFYRVGGKKEIEVDIRIISATNSDLKKEIEEGLFREDLFFRLAVVTIQVPPLRDRGDDILLIAERFLDQTGGPITITPQARECLLKYHWPGNIRELRNVLEQAIILGDGKRIAPSDLPSHIGKTGRGKMTFRLKPLSEVERQYILRALDETEGNKARAAQILGISRETLYQKLRQYEVGGPQG